MKTVATSCEESPPLVRSRIADYLELTKPRLTVLVLFTVAASFLLASNWNVDLAVLLHTLFGTALVAAGASALNHYLERDCDALMKRTESRPLPGGRLHPIEALLFGVILGSAGIAYLALALSSPGRQWWQRPRSPVMLLCTRRSNARPRSTPWWVPFRVHCLL